MVVCFNCGAELGLPVEPLYDLKTSALLIPCSVKTLQDWLSGHRADARLASKLYIGAWRSRRRLLRATEIQYIRSRMVSGSYRKPRFGTEAARAAESQREGYGEA